jgi:hypothetical protein
VSSGRRVYSGIAIRPVTRQADPQVLRSENTASLSSDARRTLLLLSPRCRDRLSKVEFEFGVRELLDSFNLQAPVLVGNDV